MDRKVTLWSKGAEELFGYKESSVMGNEIEFLYPDEVKDERRKWQKAVFSKKTVRNIRTRIYNSKGDLIHINLTLSPLIDETGKIIGTIGVSKDITNVIKAEEEIKRKIEELEKWQKLTVGRENRMIELKAEIKELKKD